MGAPLESLKRLIDISLGKWLRHLTFTLVRPYFSLFYNVSCANKHLLQDLPGGLILATHISRLDGPIVAAMLYSTRRVRPAVHYNEYYNFLQYIPMFLAGAVPLSSPKKWPAERRAKQKEWALRMMRGIIGDGGFVLLFPGGMAKRQPREIIQPHFSGAYETLKAIPDCPVVIVKLQGISKFDQPKYDFFWSFLFGMRGRRHVNMTIELLEDGLDTDQSLADFNADLEARFNDLPPWPQLDPPPEITQDMPGG